MREIKFRAWDNKAKSWLLGYDTMKEGFSLFGECVLMGEWQGILNTFLFSRNGYTPDDLKVMQYTGLKDKNGREIYEGDVIKWPTEEFANEVIFLNGSWCASAGERTLFPMLTYHFEWSESEVIGNIYQNPDLLTKSIGGIK